MPHNEFLTERIRKALTGRSGLEERELLGGIGFSLHGNTCVAVWENSLIANLGPKLAAEALLHPDVKQIEINGRPIPGWVMVGVQFVATDEQLNAWIERAERFVNTLPSRLADGGND